jgi:hypothetical protein
MYDIRNEMFRGLLRRLAAANMLADIETVADALFIALNAAALGAAGESDAIVDGIVDALHTGAAAAGLEGLLGELEWRGILHATTPGLPARLPPPPMPMPRCENKSARSVKSAERPNVK